MREIEVRLNELNSKNLDIGFVGEKNHAKVIISCLFLFDDYPNASAYMTVKPPVGDLYPVVLTKVGKKLVWEVSESDLANAGSGSFQITFTDRTGDDEEIIKTEYGNFSVRESMVANGEAPDPVTDWIADANEVLENVENSLEELGLSVVNGQLCVTFNE